MAKDEFFVGDGYIFGQYLTKNYDYRGHYDHGDHGALLNTENPGKKNRRDGTRGYVDDIIAHERYGQSALHICRKPRKPFFSVGPDTFHRF
jgi:hypothetical protein